MTNKQRTWGQFATPVDVADILLGFCLRRPDDRLLDPSCGDGALLRRASLWRSWLESGEDHSTNPLYGFELDPLPAAEAANVRGARIIQADFFSQEASAYPAFDAVIGNPPYTRAEWFGRLETPTAQPSLLPAEPDDAPLRRRLLSHELEEGLGGRAGLYAYFLVRSADFLREGGRLGFVVANGWLDVAFGAALKRFLLDHFRIVAIIESVVERWFSSAAVNTCIVILEKAGDPELRATNRVRFVRLRQPLAEILGADADSRRVSAAEQFVTRIMPPADRLTAPAAVRVRDQAGLDPGARWGALLRAPTVFLSRPTERLAPLRAWATIRRGSTTGANDFFYLDRRTVEHWGIEARFRVPLLKSLRGVRFRQIAAADCEHELLCIPPEAQIGRTAIGGYLAWGESRGIANRQTCLRRKPWYALPQQPEGDLLLAKGIWQRHFVGRVDPPDSVGFAVDQQIYRLAPAPDVPIAAVAALLNSAWFALSCEMGGRVNLGEGVLWLATYELGDILLPDPRALTAAQLRELEESYRALGDQELVNTPEGLRQPAQWANDELVFDLIGLPAGDREEVRAALIMSLDERRGRARRFANSEGG